MPASSSKRSSEIPLEEPRFGPVEQLKSENKEKKEVAKRSRKNQNPITNIKEFIKEAEKLSEGMKEANIHLDRIDRLSKYTVDNDKRKIKYKYENCLTLSIVRKNANGCLKKVLHVPTLSIHYLK